MKILAQVIQEGIPAALVIPVVSTLCGVVAFLFFEIRKERHRKSKLEREFREKVIEIDREYSEKAVKNSEEFRYELKKVLREAFGNSIKVVEILTTLESTNRELIKEVEELTRAYNNMQIKSSRGRKKSGGQ